jgi:hypothetical protein
LVVELPEPDPVEPELEPLELPEPMLPLLEPELGAGVVLGEGVVELPALPELPPLAAPELDLLKWASHSERDTCPSLFVSTDEKLGAELLELALAPPLVPPAAAPPLDDVPDEPDMPEEPLEPLPDAAGDEDEPLELEPDAAGDDEDLSLLVLLDELCATATLDNANSAAAVAALKSFRFNIG